MFHSQKTGVRAGMTPTALASCLALTFTATTARANTTYKPDREHGMNSVGDGTGVYCGGGGLTAVQLLTDVAMAGGNKTQSVVTRAAGNFITDEVGLPGARIGDPETTNLDTANAETDATALDATTNSDEAK
jgi:hypothetical protein